MNLLAILSRALNLITLGSPSEMFCARAYRKGWRICALIDALAVRVWPDDRARCRGSALLPAGPCMLGLGGAN